MVAGPGVPTERGPIVRLEKHVEIPVTREKAGEPDRQQPTRRVGPVAHLPRRTRSDQQPLPVYVPVGVLGHRDPDPLPRPGQQIALRPVEIHGARDEVTLEPGRQVTPAVRPDVGGGRLVDDVGLGQRRAAPPPAHHPWIPGVGERTRAEVGADPYVVGVDPADIGLRLGDREPAVDEGPINQVVLAYHHRVRAAPGQPDQAASVLRRQGRHTTPDPVLALPFGQRVQVEQDIPLRLRAAVLVERRTPPQPAWMGGVPPQVVVEAVAAPRRVRNAVVRVEHLPDLGLTGGELRAGGQRRDGLGIALPDPRRRLRAIQVFEPEVRVVAVIGRDRHPRTIADIRVGTRPAGCRHGDSADRHHPSGTAD